MISRNTDVPGALRSRQRGFLLDPYRFAALPAGYRYYRLFITSNNGSATYIGIDDWRLWTGLSGTGTDLAPANKLSISFSTSQGSVANFQTIITNGVGSHGLFAYGSTSNQWAKMDFGSATLIRSYSLCCSDGPFNIYPNTFRMEGSDDNSTWTTLHSVSGKTWTTNEVLTNDLTFPP